MPDYEQPYWSEYAQRIIDGLDLKQTAKGEWHGSCVNCGGTDRFWITNHQGIIKTHCRQCGDFKAIQSELAKRGLWCSLDPIKDNVLTFQPKEDFNVEDTRPYHEKKGVDLLGAKLEGNNVVIPLFNIHRQRVGEQTISPDGKKLFSTGLDKSEGVFGVAGKLTKGRTYVAEGWATSASIAMSHSGCACIFALDAGNLPLVCSKLQTAFPQFELIVAADNDEKGIEAAKKTKLPYVVPPKKGQDFNDLHQELGLEAVYKSLTSVKKPDTLFTMVSDLRMTATKWMIKDVIEDNSLTMIFGSAGSGKTFLALDMALCIATGKPYHELEVQQGSVAYIAGEGHAGFAKRVAAWCKNFNQDLTGVPFAKSNRSVILNDPDSELHLCNELDALQEQIGKLNLIVLDTLSRTLDGEENNQNMMAYVQVCDRLKDRYQCTVMIVHHIGHQNKDRGRGAYALHGSLDSEYRVEQWGDFKILLTPTKMKDEEKSEPLAFMKLSVSLVDADGQDTSSLVLEMTPDKPLDKKSPDYAEQVVKEQFDRMNDFGEVSRSDLKEAVALELECSQRTANRHIKRMIDQGVLKLEKGAIWGAFG